MNINPTAHRNAGRIASLVLTLGCLAALPASAQQAAAPASPAVTAAGDDEAIVLSPFEVSTKKDVGYLAQNTLAGSRLNTELKDTGAAISVMTPEFLKDIGATSMKDVILFSNNAVPEYGDSASNFNANPMIGNAEYQLRIRGLPASYARNFFSWETSTDFYNIDRIDESRGPNAILFGFGSAGGIVNTSTKQAKLSNLPDEVSVTVGSWDRYRGSFDVNRAFDKKLGVRVNAVAETNKSWRQYELARQQRAHLAAKYAFTPTSSLRGEVEVAKIHDNWARPWLMIDQTQAWRDAGSPTYSSAQWSSTIVNQVWANHMVYVGNTGVTADYKNLPFSYSSSRGWSALAMNDKNLAIIPTDSNPAGDGAYRDTNYNTEGVFYENQLTRDLTLEVAYNHQSTRFTGYDASAGNMSDFGYLGDATELWADASTVTPTGAANPNAGKFFVENNWTKRHQTLDADAARATLAYTLNAGKFGKHRFAALYEHSWRDTKREEDAEVFTGSPFATNAEYDSNRVFRRTYITPGDAASIKVPSWEIPITNATNPNTGAKLATGWVPNQSIENNKQEQNTFLAAVQSNFFSDKLVTVLGLRHDKVDYSTLPTVRGSDGILRLGTTRTERSFNANTMSAGVVYHVIKEVSVFANGSTSRSLPNVYQRVIGGGMPPMPEGKGSDFGVKLDLLGGKLYSTISYYTTDLKHTSEWGNIQTSVTNLNNRILGVLQSNGLISSSDVTARTLDANGYLEDRKADGWEFSLIANPTSNWRVSFNFSINNVVKENIMAEVASYWKDNSAWWLQKAATKGGSSMLLGQGDWDTLGNQIGWTNDYISSMTAFNGKSARGERQYGSNLYTRYQFDNGAMKGFYVGGGGRYQSANIIGMNGTQQIKGRSLILWDGSAGYEFNTKLFGHKTSVDLQLNVANLFNSKKYQVYTTAWWDSTASTPERIGLQEPRKVTFSATLKF